MRKFERCVLLTRVGSFYETLVQELEQHVAISEEVPNTASPKSKSGGLLFDRRVSRIVTPGTLIDERFMNTSQNNYLLAVSVYPTVASEDTADSSRGCEANDGDHRPSASIPSSADAWNPRIESPMSQSDAQKFTAEEIGAGTCLLDYVEVQLQGLQMRLQRPIRRQAEEIMSIDKNSMRALEIKSTLRDGVLKGSLLHTMQLTVTNSGARLLSDWLTAPSTSLAVINGRLDLVSFFLEDETLREKITQSLGCSHDSQRLVQKFSLGRGDPEDLVSLSKTIVATREISTLLGQSCRDATDQFVLQSPSCVKDIMTRFDLDEPALLADRISRAIDDEGLMRRQRLHEDEAAGVIAMAQEVATSEGVQPRPAKGQKTAVEKSGHASATASASRVEDEDVWVMRRSASTTLSRLHDHLDKLVTEKAELEHELRLKHGANTLTLRWTPGLGHICHVKGKDIRSSLSSADKIRSVSASKSTKSFHLPEWTALGTRLDQAKLQIRAEEQHVFRILRDEVIMDEVGRGTTSDDGVAVAYACLDHLYHVNRCRALFATHFHELADMTKNFEHFSAIRAMD
ncbi:MAG: DNA mismatch repair ATPase msh1 [Thelocarpon impressellum]|nr:MAG: DNA mismatch repair ATPase msh1 [Thelocarpon impressellum]